MAWLIGTGAPARSRTGGRQGPWTGLTAADGSSLHDQLHRRRDRGVDRRGGSGGSSWAAGRATATCSGTSSSRGRPAVIPIAAERANRSVAIVRAPGRPPAAGMLIVVGVDGSTGADRAVRLAATSSDTAPSARRPRRRLAF